MTKKQTNKHSDRSSASELVFAISNVAHAEYHLVEMLVVNAKHGQRDNNDNNIDGVLLSKLYELRDVRTTLMDELCKMFPTVGSAWCLLKHLMLAEFHLFELVEKTKNTSYLLEAKTIHLMIDELLVLDELKDFKDCVRCDEN